MRIARISKGDDDGQSVFSDVDIAFPLPIPGYENCGLSAPTPSPGVQFIRMPDDLDIAMHPAPRRQFVVVLTGAMEVRAPNGETRTFRAGDILLAEDTDTSGHTTRVVEAPCYEVWIPVESYEALAVL